MKMIKILLVLIFLLISISAVSAEGNFTALQDEINLSTGSIDINQDYVYDNGTDHELKKGIVLNKNDFTINGNGHTIDASNQSRIFDVQGKNITINNLVLINANGTNGGAIYTIQTLTLNNVTFSNNYATNTGGAIGLYGNATLNCSNIRFIDNYAPAGSSISVQNGNVNLYNSNISSKMFNKYSQIAALSNGMLYVENTTFVNCTSSYSPAFYLRGSKTSIVNSRFINLKANITSGAIGVRYGGALYIEKCEFINTTSSKNAGAIFADIGSDEQTLNVCILDSLFKDTYSEFGGGILQLNGNLLVNNTEFINTHATYNGGAIFTSSANGEINNCTFDSNGVELIDDYPTYGGAIYWDMGGCNITKSRFINNTASAGDSIYTYDSSYIIADSVFENNANPVYTVFDENSSLTNNTYINGDNVSTNNTYYATIISGEGLELTLMNNSINVTALPKKFDLRDWGWVSPVRNQGWMGACWTFGMTGALESTLLKATGIKTDFSENNMRNVMLRYSIYGTGTSEGGYDTISSGYLLSWLGAFTQDADTYDEMGKISPVIRTNQDFHAQDIIFIPNNEIPNGTQIKEAILKYGSLDVCYYGQSTYNEKNPYYNPSTYAQYINETKEPNHEVSVVGWDDNFPKEKFLITPPGDGAWIIKNSWGERWGNEGYLYVSYYDKSLLSYSPGDIINYAATVLIENTVPYNKNYQYDMTWLGNYSKGTGPISYMNVFEALENDAIAAVGTYFNDSNINYTVEIYVNDELKLTQEGISPYVGYHTIKLNEYIPIKKGDIFKAIMTTNNMPFIATNEMRVHYIENISFVSIDGKTWNDCYKERKIACLKVYTVALPIYTEDLVKIYKNASKFEANIAEANKTVTFEINGERYTRTSDENGTARMTINLEPGNYTIKTIYNNASVENTITVLPTLIGENLIKYFRNASHFYISLINGEGSPISGINITMNINGVFYNRLTNENGTAKLNINLEPGEYILTAIDPLTGLQMSYNITVLPVLIANDLEMRFKDGSTFNAMVLDGEGKPLANAKVTFNVNGVFYTRYSNSSGIAKLNINLMAGEYIITSEFDEMRISNTITIKD